MSLLAYFALLPAILIGFLTISLIFGSAFSENSLLLTLLSIPLGLGITSCTYFLWSYFSSPNSRAYFIFEIIVIVILLFVVIKKYGIHFDAFKFKFWENKIELILSILAISIVVISIISFIQYIGANPHGRYDAWAIWNVRARMIARSSEEWKIIFNPAIFHADYPLLLPLTIARAWVLAGTESIRIPQAVAAMYTFVCVGILGAGLKILKSRSLAWLAVIVFLGTPWVIFNGSKQFADLPLAANILSAIVCLTFALFRREECKPWLILAGLFCGLAGWTKNEGLLFVVCLVVVLMIAILLQRKRYPLIKSVLFLGIGLVLPIVTIGVFKLTLAPSNDLLDTNHLSETIAFLLTPERYAIVFHEMTDYSGPLGGWVFPLWLFLLIFVLLTFSRNKTDNLPKVMIGLVLLLQWIGYFFTYVITPHDIVVHVLQSYDRLLIHLYPALLFWLLLFAHPIEELFPTKQKSITPPAV